MITPWVSALRAYRLEITIVNRPRHPLFFSQNFPSSMIARKVAAALAAGYTATSCMASAAASRVCVFLPHPTVVLSIDGRGGGGGQLHDGVETE